MTNEETTTITTYKSESNWIWKLKKKLNKDNSQQVLRSIRKLINLHKMEGELK